MEKRNSELIDFAIYEVLHEIVTDPDEYETYVVSIDIELLWDSFHGSGYLFFDLPELDKFDQNNMPNDSHMLLLFGYAVYNKIFDFNHTRHHSTICNEESDLNDCLDRMFLDLRTNWDSSQCTLNDYLLANWAMVVFDKDDGSFGIPLKR